MFKPSIFLPPFFALFFLASANGQQTSLLRGRITDEAGAPLTGTNIFLLDAQDSAFIKGAATGTGGMYELPGIAVGQYVIRVSEIGYEPKQTQPFTVAPTPAGIELPTIVLTPSAIALQAATVTAARPFIERRADRMVLNLENSIVDAGSTVWEVLEKSPGVVADQNANLSIVGKEGVLVLIDNKPTQLSGEQLASLLRGMSTRTVEKIEIITNPPARYDAAGTAGIINILSRRSEQDGAFALLSLTGGAGWQTRLNPAASLHFNRGRWKTFANYSFTDGGYLQRFTLLRNIKTAEQDFVFDQKSNEDHPVREHQLNGGLDWSPGKIHRFGVGGRLFERRGKVDGSSGSILTDRVQSPALSYLDVDKNTGERLSNYGLNVHYSGKSGEIAWSADADFIRYDIHSDEYYNVQYSLPGAGVFRKQELRNLESTDIGIRAYQAEAQFPLGKNAGLGTGLKMSRVRTGNSIRFDSLSGQEWFPDLEKTNAFDYDEDVYAAFASFHTQWKKADIQAGLRLERTSSEGDVASATAALKRRYTDFFPSFSINIPLRNQRQIGISYSRRIDRPGYQRLNPFLFFIDPFTYAQGDPLLRPQYTDNMEISWQRRPWSVVAGVSHTRDVNTFVSSQNDSLLVGIAGTRNLDHLYNINLTVTGQQQITAWWSAFNFFSVYYNRYRSALFGGMVDIGAFALRMNTSQSFKLPGGLKAEVSAFYQSPGVRGISRTGAIWQVNCGLQRSFFQNALQVKLSANDLFNSFIAKGNTRYQTQDVRFSYRTLYSRVAVTLACNIGNREAGKVKKRKSGAEAEEKRVGE